MRYKRTLYLLSTLQYLLLPMNVIILRI